MELQTAAAILGAMLPKALINNEILPYLGIEDSLCQLKEDNPALVRWLIARGAKVSHNNYMPFAQATIMGCIDNLRVLFGQPDINLVDLQCSWSPVDIAISHGYVDILRFLFDIGLTFTDTSVYYISFSVRPLIQFLIETGHQIAFDGLNAALDYAVQNGHISTIQHLIELAGAQLNFYPTICEAITSKHFKEAHILIDAVSKKPTKDIIMLNYALTRAASVGELSIVKRLIDIGADPAHTPIMQTAAEEGHLFVVRFLAGIPSVLDTMDIDALIQITRSNAVLAFLMRL